MKYLFLSFVTIILIGIGCSKTDNIRQPENLKQFEDYLIYGDVHNEFIGTIVLHHSNDEPIDSTSFWNYTKSIWYQTEVEFTLIDEEVNDLFTANTFGYDYLKSSNLRKSFNSDELKNDLLFLKSNQIIDDFEFSFITNFITELENLNDFDELLIKTNKYIDLWKSQSYLKNSNIGEFSAIILAITKRSTEWWLENEDQIGSQTTQRGAPWLALDAAGAIVSGTIAGVAEYQLTGSCCGDTFGVAVVGGAVAASTGLVGKVANGIKWLWP